MSYIFPVNIFCNPHSNLPDGRSALRQKYIIGWVIGLAQKMT